MFFKDLPPLENHYIMFVSFFTSLYGGYFFFTFARNYAILIKSI